MVLSTFPNASTVGRRWIGLDGDGGGDGLGGSGTRGERGVGGRVEGVGSEVVLSKAGRLLVVVRVNVGVGLGLGLGVVKV